MNRAELLKRLDAMLADAERTGMFGKIEIELCGGTPMFLRQMRQEKLVKDTRYRGNLADDSTKR